jgi:peptidoglycan/xylan/chitin deacetylase (PgdA/CDA1 family)
MVRAFVLIAAAAALTGCQNTPSNLPLFPRRAEPEAPKEPPTTYNIHLNSLDNRVMVLMYHDMVAARDRNALWYDCTPDELRKQIDLVLAGGGTFISVDQLHRHLMLGEPVPDRAVCITFDDNYQGVYDHAVPVLREYNVPYAVFVHTAFVGGTAGRPKMSWDTLRELVKDPLCTIGSHTVNHPPDITQLIQEDQRRELVDSKIALERELGKPIHYLAYPDGKNDRITQLLAQESGYKLAFSTKPYWAEASPNLLSVGRFEQSTLERRWAERERELERAATGTVIVPIQKRPVTVVQGTYGSVKLSMLKGGTPKTILSDTRETVSEFIAREPGAVAGINGGFFSLAAIAATDNRMVGPCLPENSGVFYPDPDDGRVQKLVNRPMVFWDGEQIGFAPFMPNSMNSRESVLQVMPNVTSLFVAGTWMVHGGIPMKREALTTYGAQDVMDYRRRAFFGVDFEGNVICGASMGSYTTEQVAEAAALAGLKEAVLLDSGFSTSLVVGQDVIASGHSTPTKPSRPVPHAIVLLGELDPDAKYEKLPAPNAERRRRR